MSTTTPLTGRTALISGAAHGQGAAEARLLAARGAHVILGDVADEDGHRTADAIGPAARFVHLDVRKEEDWQHAVAIATAPTGHLDILVNNAGVYRTAPIEEQTPEDFLNLLHINLLGAFHGIRAAIEPMRTAGGGSIINISSLAGLRGYPAHAAYASSKWALRGLTQVTALDLAPHGIRVNCVLPGTVATRMIDHIPPDQTAADVPLGRTGTAEEVAALIAFLASDDASYITGAEFVIDGGASAGRT